MSFCYTRRLRQARIPTLYRPLIPVSSSGRGWKSSHSTQTIHGEVSPQPKLCTTALKDDSLTP